MRKLLSHFRFRLPLPRHLTSSPLHPHRHSAKKSSCCYTFYESIDNILNIQNEYLLKLYYIIYNKNSSKKTIREDVIKHRNKLLNIKEDINNISFLLSYKLEFNKKLIDMYINIKTFEYNKIVDLISQCLNYIKLLNILINFFNVNNETFYNDIKILEKKMNNNNLLFISI